MDKGEGLSQCGQGGSIFCDFVLTFSIIGPPSSRYKKSTLGLYVPVLETDAHCTTNLLEVQVLVLRH